VIGLSFIAQRESTHMALRYWPVLFLLLPMGLALIVNTGPFQRHALILIAVLLIWMARSLYFAFWSAQRNIGRAVSGLLAGIALVDALAVVPGAPWAVTAFAALFLLALVFQKFVPAT
jgi:hypothetical protein